MTMIEYNPTLGRVRTITDKLFKRGSFIEQEEDKSDNLRQISFKLDAITKNFEFSTNYSLYEISAILEDQIGVSADLFSFED